MKQWGAGPDHILYEPRALATPSPELFDPEYWRAGGRVEGRAPGRGAVVFVRTDIGGIWALRHYKRGGQVGRLVEDSYLYLGLEATRPWREMRLTSDLHARGLPVPKAVAAHVRRRGPLYRGNLITERIAGAEPLADALAVAPMQPLQWLLLGKMLRRFHDAGVCHEDINVRNVLRDAKGAFHLIDFDKARLLPSGAWKAENLARFKRSLDKLKAADARFHFEGVDWQALLSGYNP